VEKFGWTALDLFAVHPIAPVARFDKMGLVLVICGGEVVALTTGSASRRFEEAPITSVLPL
jgi:hypothetical protein